MVLLWIVVVYYAFSVSYLFLLSVAGTLKAAPTPTFDEGTFFHKQLMLIPAYMEDAVIMSTVRNVQSQNYPVADYDVIVIADSLKKETIKALNEKVQVIEVSFDQSTKAKSLNEALKKVDGTTYDIVHIIDADNFLEPDYLKKVNVAFNAGHEVIQCRRVAKNMGSQFSVLDALSEVVNNHIYRKGPQRLGLSCSLIGSGMAFKADLLKQMMQKVDAIGGFDRQLQMHIVERGIKIHYLEKALVYDEKVEKGAQFESQRRRWIASQYHYLSKYLVPSFNNLIKGNMDYFHLGFIQNFFLPKYLNLGSLMIITSIAILVDFYSAPSLSLLLLAFFHILALLIPIPRKFYNLKLAKAVLFLPITFFYMVRSLVLMKGANKQFIHTEHNTVEIDHDLFEKH